METNKITRLYEKIPDKGNRKLEMKQRQSEQSRQPRAFRNLNVLVVEIGQLEMG
jgi:hypothetical protein